jgi:spore maturation protein CgeB
MKSADAGADRRSDTGPTSRDLTGCLCGAAIRICVIRAQGVIAPQVMNGFERAFRKLGLATRLFDISAMSSQADQRRRELSDLMTWKPTIAVCYGFTGLTLGSLLRAAGVPLALLFYDSPFGVPWKTLQECLDELRSAPDSYHCFVWDRAYLEAWKHMGARHVHPTMLAADTSTFPRRTPSYRYDVSFAGRMGDPTGLRQMRQAVANPRTNDFVDRLIEQKLACPSKSLLELWAELVRESFPDMLLDWNRPGMGELHLHIHREGSARLRQTLLQRIRSARPDIFGADWEMPGAGIHPPVDYAGELPGVYADSRINVNITALQLEYSVNNRIFDVAAVGGFLLTDHREDLRRVFPEFGKMTYHSGDELDDMVAYFLSHEGERRDLAAELQKAVLAHHTYEHRAFDILQSIAASS